MERVPKAIPPAASTPTTTHTHGRRQIGGLRTTSGRRGAAATARRPRARPLLLMAMWKSPSLLLQDARDQDRKLVEDYQGHHQRGHGEPVLAGRDDRRDDRDEHQRVAPPV